MEQVIVFDKTLQQRLQEYQEMYSSCEKRNASQLKKEWSFFLELSMDPNGWQAIWKIPRLTCEALQISFPTIVLVYVKDIDFTELCAIITIIAVQEEISLPEEHFVPLLQLWPTKEQDKTVALNIETTANCLDMYRFFYINIFLPWDYDTDNTSDWVETHLQSRLRLYYDMKNGTIPRAVAEHLRFILTKAKRLGGQREQIEEELIDYDIDASNDVEDNRVQTLMDLNVNIIELKSEFELLENPVTRNVIIKRQKNTSPKSFDKKPQSWLVLNEGKADEVIGFLDAVKASHASDSFKFTPLLSMVLEEINTSNDLIILKNTTHVIAGTSGLEKGGYIKGMYDSAATVIKSSSDTIMFDFTGGNIVLENLTLDASSSKCGILIRAGKTLLKNCKLIANSTSSTHQGVLILNGGELEMVDCEVNGFCTGIIGNTGAKITLGNTHVCNASFGVKIFDNCEFKAENCVFRDCKEHGFCLETSGEINGNQSVGSFDLLQIVPNMSLKDVKGGNNSKGDVVINHVQKITPITDLFSNPKIDPIKKTKSFSETSDEDMDFQELNNTVIENDTIPVDK